MGVSALIGLKSGVVGIGCIDGLIVCIMEALIWDTPLTDGFGMF